MKVVDDDRPDIEPDDWQERMRLIREAAIGFADSLADIGHDVIAMADWVRRMVDASMNVDRA